MVKIISIEADIGAGKTTLINSLIERHEGNYILIPEPVDQWKTIMIGDQNILEAFYNDMVTVALPFQLIALITRRELFVKKMKEAEELEKTTGKEVYLISERTVHSDKYIFAKMLYKDGFISEPGIIAYNMWNDIFSKEAIIDKTIYINTPPEVCFERIKIRNRQGEDKITLEYLRECQKAHDDFYEEHISKNDHVVIDTSGILVGTIEYDNLLNSLIAYINL